MERPLLDDEAAEQGVSARLARQELYDRRPAPLLSFILDEGVLRRPIGGKVVLRAQLEQIIRVGEKRNVEIQVMPFDREVHAALGGPFTLIDNVQGQCIAYAEVQGESRLSTARTMVRDLEARYGIIRSQALTPRESLEFIRKLLGKLWPSNVPCQPYLSWRGPRAVTARAMAVSALWSRPPTSRCMCGIRSSSVALS